MIKKGSKKTKTTTSKKTKKVAAKKPKKKSGESDFEIVFVDEDVNIDKESELEARRAYLEESRSQESSGD